MRRVDPTSCCIGQHNDAALQDGSGTRLWITCLRFGSAPLDLLPSCRLHFVDLLDVERQSILRSYVISVSYNAQNTASSGHRASHTFCRAATSRQCNCKCKLAKRREDANNQNEARACSKVSDTGKASTMVSGPARKSAVALVVVEVLRVAGCRASSVLAMPALTRVWRLL